MYLAMPYFVFMEAMVPCLIHSENASHVWNPYFLFRFCRLVGKGEDGPCVRKPHEEANDAIVLYMIFRVLLHTPNGPY